MHAVLRPFRSQRRGHTLAAIALFAPAALAQVPSVEPTAAAIEFYNRRLDHYFITADVDEAAMLDAGSAVPGWTRTGAEFNAWATSGDAAAAVPVCRFFGTPGRGPDSHFYTADAAECAQVKSNPDWTFEGIAFWIELPQAGSCRTGSTPVYRSFHPGAQVGESNHRFVIDLTLHARMAGTSTLEGVVMCSPLSTAQVEADAARLLEQAAWGPTEALLAQVRDGGVAQYLDRQFALPATRYTAFAPVPANRPASCVDDRTLPLGADSFCARDNYTLFQLQREFFRNAVHAPDQLRQRVAFALSQILVTSGLEINKAYAMQRYQQQLVDLAFDNFERVLTAVTLSPAMGRYLDMANNVKPNAATGAEPNENYARELLQLFSIGTVLLNADGTPRLDANGKPIPAYDQAEIEGFAHVFTGWTYPTAPGQSPRALNGQYYDGAMEERSAAHDTAEKTLLDATVPANLPMSQDLAAAIRNVFLHPNVGPFISKQLIQKLVTGDPSPGYVARVAAAFDDNGAGVRGDLKAVVRAVLLDAEARGPVKLDPGYGKLREPVKFVAAAARALDAATDGVFLRAQPAAMGQPVFIAPSVFNYYPPDYIVPGTGVLGPEFALQNTTSSFARINFANALAYTTTIAPDPTVYGATGTQLDWSPLAARAADPAALVARLDRLLTHGTLSSAARSAVAAAVSAVPAGDALGRARMAFYLVLSSSQYQVER
ncbi:MAG: DUF1800 domain-containing protein [Betaproteobacteria bacterium]|nr:DUF1800 domain-containing protein [Betaproteobacteria bacterium]